MSISTNIEYFIEIAKQKNISKAAEKLYISQPALSKYLKSLENHIGTSLVIRSSSGLQLTKAGEYYLEFAKSVFVEQKKLQDILVAERLLKTSNIKIGIIPWDAQSIMGTLYNHFYNNYPNINIQFYIDSNITLREMLSKNELDIAIMTYFAKCYSPDFFLGSRDLYLIVSNRHKIAQQYHYPVGPITKILEIPKESLEGQTIILPRPHQPLRNAAEDFFERNPLNINILETDHISGIVNMAQSGSGIAFIYMPIHRNIQQYDNLVFYKIKDLGQISTGIFTSKEFSNANRNNHIFKDIKEIYQP